MKFNANARFVGKNIVPSSMELKYFEKLTDHNITRPSSKTYVRRVYTDTIQLLRQFVDITYEIKCHYTEQIV